MQNFRKIASMLCIAASMAMTACDPDGMFDITDTVPATDTANDLCDTEWLNELHDTYEDEDGVMQQSVETNIIGFQTATSGEMTWRYVTATRNDEVHYPFTYSYTSPNGSLTIGDEGGVEAFDFAYNAANNTLTLYGSGGYWLVFSRI